MKTKLKNGSVLLAMMIVTFVTAIAAVSAMNLVLTEQRLSRNSNQWMQSLHTAEAGIECGMLEYHRDLHYSDGWGDWEHGRFSNIYKLTNQDLDNTKFSVVTDTNSLSIISHGTCKDIIRIVEVILRLDLITPWTFGLLAKNKLKIIGTPAGDSFDSRLGPYGGRNVSTNCDIGAMGEFPDAISGGGSTWFEGDAHIAPGADIEVTPATFWSGDTSDELDVDFPVITPPSTVITRAPLVGGDVVTVSNYLYVGVLFVNASRGNKTITFIGSGLCQLYCFGDFSVGTPEILEIISHPMGANLSLEIYVNGNLSLLGELNSSPGSAANLKIFGTENCEEINVTANRDKSLVIYAPDSNVNLGGTAQIFGSVIGRNIDCFGTFKLHYDEALANEQLKKPERYIIDAWIEH